MCFFHFLSSVYIYISIYLSIYLYVYIDRYEVKLIKSVSSTGIRKEEEDIHDPFKTELVM